MTTTTAEVVYTGRDNSIDLLLTENGVSIPNYTALIRIVMTLGVTVIDSDLQPSAFDWTGNKLICKLGLSGIPAGEHTAKVETWDVSNPNGVVWTDSLLVIVR